MAKKLKLEHCLSLDCPNLIYNFIEEGIYDYCGYLNQPCPSDGVLPNCPLPDYDEGFQWIPIKERLPEYAAHAGGSEFTIVLCYYNGDVYESLYTDGNFFVLDIDVTEHVTHWMPLPPPPKGVW